MAYLPFPTGTTLPYAGSTAPSGWLLCYGQAVSRTTYANLFTVLSTTYGSGDGSTTFNLPDLRGRLPAGQDNMGGSAANRITSGGSGITGTTLGAAGGAETHTLTTAQLSSHNHTQDAHTHTQNSHSHSGAFGTNNSGGLTRLAVPGDNVDSSGYSISSTTPTNQNTTATNQTAGSGNAHNNTQPTIILTYIIKT